MTLGKALDAKVPLIVGLRRARGGFRRQRRNAMRVSSLPSPGLAPAKSDSDSPSLKSGVVEAAERPGRRQRMAGSWWRADDAGRALDDASAPIPAVPGAAHWPRLSTK
jgi:hypothetical protein